MDTLEDLIADVLDRMVRPDLLPMARKVARSVLFNLHATSDFHRDLVRTAAEPVTSDTTAIALPQAFRKLHGVLGFDATGKRITGLSYTPAKLEVRDSYFGVTNLQAGYYLIGGSVKLLHCYPLPYQVQLEYFAFPAYTLGLDGTVTTDSWMLGSAYELVALSLLFALSAHVANKDQLVTLAPLLQQEKIFMLAREQTGA